MIKIEFGDVKLNIPDGWADIKLSDYEKWFMLKATTKHDYVKFVADVCKIDVDRLLDWPAQVFTLIAESIRFISDTDLPPSNKVHIGGEEYYIALSDKLTLGEWVDIEEALQADSKTKISDVLSIVCRPVGESYNPEKSEKRKELFRNLPCDKALPLINFFLFKKKKSEAILNHYSTVLEQADRFLKDTKTFVLNGDGIKLLPIWQRIRYTYLTRSLERRLSKFSDFYSTK